MSPNGRKKQKAEEKAAKETIHSGHFMVSDIDDSEIQDGEDSVSLVVHESDCEQESSPLPDRGYDFESACMETSKTYVFGPRSSLSISIDASLTKLFECMTLAYSGKLTSPRWKQFKGLKLRLKEKIRLNNIIWRAWHMQFIMRQKTFVCQFASPLDGDIHTKPEAVVIEGTYWKRRMANIKAEYQKWRLFYKDQFKLKPSTDSEKMAIDFDSRWPQRSFDTFSTFSNSMEEDFIMDFSDTLFSSFNPSQPFDFPNPREIAARAGIADFIQPGLVQLQPSLEDFMDTLEPLQDFLSSKLPSLPEEVSDNMSDLTTGMNPDVNIFGSSQKSMFITPDLNSFSSMSSTKRNSDLKRKVFSQQRMQRMTPPDKLLMDNLISTNILEEDNARSAIEVDQISLGRQQMPCENNMPISSNLSSNDSVLQPVLQSSIQPCVPLVQNSLLNQNYTPLVSSSLSSSNSNSVKRGLLMNNKVLQNTHGFQPVFQRHDFMNPSAMNNKQQLFQPTQSVPLTQRQQQPSISQSDIHPKNASVPFFFAVDLGDNTQILQPSTTNVDLTMQLQNVFSSVIQQSVQQQQQQPAKIGEVLDSGHKSSLKKLIESPVFRRHSYATGQPTAVTFQSMTETLGNRRSRRIAPATLLATSPPVINFAVPEVPSRSRTRSRSMSSPQGESPKPIAQQSSQAVSLTDISLPQFSNAQRERILLPDLKDTNVTSSGFQTLNVLPQNAVLAQLLSTGRNLCDSNMNKDTSILSTPSSPVTILESIPSSQAYVFSPIPLTTVAGVSDFQKNLLVGAANQVFGSPSNSYIVPSPSSSNSGSPVGSSTSLAGSSFDASSAKSVRPKSREDKTQYKEHRRVCHINAEQKRRCNIKNGFESLQHLLPPMSQIANSKVSKAALLQRSAEYIRTLKNEKKQKQDEADQLEKQIEELNQVINNYQSQLPASGVPVPCQKTNKMKEMFEEYVRQQTLKNWKFWIFSLILEPLLESYSSNVSTANVDEMCKTILAWLDQHCSLVALRPGVLNSLRHLSTSTNILSDPSCMPEEATRAVFKKEPWSQ